MLVLELHPNKELYLSKKSSVNFTGENNFEKIRIIASPTVGDKDLKNLTTELYIYGFNDITDDEQYEFNDCVPCEFTEKCNELLFETPIKAQYTAYPYMGMYLKFSNADGVIGKTNSITTVILKHKDGSISVASSIEIFEKYLKVIKNISLNAPHIGEDGFWYVFKDGKYVCTDIPAQGETGADGAKGDKGDKGEKGDKGDKGDAGTTDYNELENKPDLSIYANKTYIIDSQETTVELESNKFYKFNEVTELNLTLKQPANTYIYNEYMFEFISGEISTTLTLPDTVKWLETPTIEANKIYQCSIVNNIGVLLGVSNE